MGACAHPQGRACAPLNSITVIESPAGPRRTWRPSRRYGGGSARQARQAPGLDRVAHRARHPQRVLRTGDRAGGHHRVATELHRQRRVGGRADAGVEHDRHLHGFADQGDVVGVANAHAAADRRAERHHRRAADVDQAPGEDRIVGRVGQDREAVVDELLGRAQQLGGVGQQRVLVADHLELHQVGLERLSRELRGEDGIARGEAAGGVRQQLDSRLGEHIHERAARGRIDPAQRDRHELRAAARDRLGHQLQRGKAARAEQETRGERAPGDHELVGLSVRGCCGHPHPPCIAVSTSTRASAGSAERLPVRAGDDLAIDRDGDTARVERQPQARERRRDGLAGLQVGSLAIEQDHAATPASASTTSSAVSGASRMPLR